MKSKYILHIISLLALFISFLPVSHANALAAAAPPPVDMFQLPWELGKAWVAIDGIDNGSKRPASSSHNYKLGGAIDFAPHNNMVTGENTSSFWVTAAGAGTVIQTSTCYVTLAHDSGWITQYQFLGNIQVKLGDVVARNQRLGIIADGIKYKYCPGFQEINVPHLHFMLRPSILGATFAGWEVKYNSLFNITTFSKGLIPVGLYKPLLNVFDTPATPTPTATQTGTTTPGTGTPSGTPSTPTPTTTVSPTPTLSGPFVSTVVSPSTLNVGETALVTVSLNNVPTGGYTSAEFTCTYDPNLFEVSNITAGNLFGADPATALNGPQNGKFIFAIAANDGNRATTNGAVFTFNIKGLQPGQTNVGCNARVSTGNNTLTEIPATRALVTVNGSTPTPSLTPTGTLSTPSPTTTMTVTPSVCDQAEFIAHITVPPGTVFAPGAQFTKTWRLQNVGTCTWTTSYQLVFFSGEQMGAVSSASFPRDVAPGQSIDVSLNMTAPSAEGSYRGNWMFKNSSGALFGTGPQANEPWFVDINVSTTPASPTFTPTPASSTPTASPTSGGSIDTPTPTSTPGGSTSTPIAGVAYDFAANACTATWFSGAGQLPCPGVDGDPKGFVLLLSNPKLENGNTDSRPSLLTFPQNVQNGYIQGFYPPFHVQSGDRFRATLSCEWNATDCYVAYRLDYQVGSEAIKTLWGAFLERYDGQSFSVDADLSSLAGQDVKFILTLQSAGIATGDRAMWVGPIIYRAGSGSTPTATLSPTPTATSVTGDWLTFTNTKYSFQFKYPQQGQIGDDTTDNFVHIDLPFAAGTNLREKFLESIVAENLNPCRSPLGTSSMLQTSETVVINGITFLKETGEDRGAGNIHQWVAYSTSKNNACVSLDFVLHSLNPDNFPTPPPVFDFAAESAVFGQIVSTYAWLTLPTPTPTTPAGSPTPTFTATPSPSITPTPMNAGVLNGKVIASKTVTINVYDANNVLVGSGTVNPDGTFALNSALGTNKVIATASGFLSAQTTVTITDGATITLPNITLLAGDIDGNNVIDQFDALTIGMSYNAATPSQADLNNDGTINVLDLELLAKNYRKTGPVPWQ